MEATFDLLKEVTKLGFNRDYAMHEIDMVLDDEVGVENRKPINIEVLPEELYKAILETFKEGL